MLIFLVACAPRTPTVVSPPSPPPPEIWVSGYRSEAIHRFDIASGELAGTIEGLPGAQAVRPYEDGFIVVAEEANRIERLDATLALGTPLVADDPALVAPTGVAVRDGIVYVGGYGSGAVHRYDEVTGSALGILADGMQGPDAGLTFGPEGTLFVPCFDGDRVVELAPESGDVLREFAVDSPRMLVFEGDTLWVTSWRAGRIRRFALDGTDLPDFASVDRPSGLALTEDAVWVTSDQDNRIRQLDRDTGEQVGRIAGTANGVDGATFLTVR